MDVRLDDSNPAVCERENDGREHDTCDDRGQQSNGCVHKDDDPDRDKFFGRHPIARFDQVVHHEAQTSVDEQTSEEEPWQEVDERKAPEEENAIEEPTDNQRHPT
eukprot:CAMPEP_0202085648 /NCGR_PEP_ID=MMETSP0964-20121228/31359_1 /ASSEMBLY_ACC=CAM_ASM_000500 /TAXON_ID=4773 /ORGANISM="Schizochytrium aggregatum, Strain ATCC28209" /LENGTH=104 /DNA_ID=CAMNT_0048653487 /DNA_START=133 /DNA_END=447 /DNA_ORIENTATION=-